jgi:REP element-mobilizing transposase RayT
MRKKPNYDPKKHHRRSIRLKGYNYSSEGFYFITICTEGRRCLFGTIINGKMVLNDYGKIVDNEWQNTIKIRNGDVVLHEYVIMPNHIHAIIQIHRGVSHTPNEISHTPNEISHTPNEISHTPNEVSHTPFQSPSKTLGAIIRGFKGAVSKQIGKSIWQRNYYESIINDKQAFENISKYIRNNPAKWG